MKEYFVNSVSGESMKPFFENGDLFAFRNLKKEETINRKDVILFWHPLNKGGKMLKRVIGLPNEKITYKDGVITIEKEGLKSTLAEPYISQHPTGDFAWELGGDDFLILGDNRSASQDSRVFGPIKGDKIIAKIIGRLTRLGRNGSSYRFLNWE